jgi:hypothetical protein
MLLSNKEALFFWRHKEIKPVLNHNCLVRCFSQPVNSQMSLASGFGEAVAPTAMHDDIQGALQADSMAG